MTFICAEILSTSPCYDQHLTVEGVLMLYGYTKANVAYKDNKRAKQSVLLQTVLVWKVYIFCRSSRYNL